MTAASRSRSELALSAWAVTAAFGAYFCMYAFRKPFTATSDADWGGVTFLDVGFKTVLVAAQVAGYTLSKFIGIKVIAEMRPERRVAWFLGLMGLAHVALLLFAVVPPPWNWVCLFVNGLPLGMVFGLVLSFLEGRRMTEALTAGLCASFILAGGVMKTVGQTLLNAGVGPYWMPFAAGALFALPMVGFVAMLSRIPPPSEADVAARRARAPMTAADRWGFFSRYALGLSLLVFFYLLLTVLRSMRDDYGKELWLGLGYDLGKDQATANLFFWSDLWVALGVTAVTGAAVLIRSNRGAFFAALAASLAGLALAGYGLVGVARGWVDGFGFMVLVGLGLYVPYVAVHTTIFERLIALVRDRGNLGFLMYLADSFGYLGFVAVMVARSWGGPVGGAEFLAFFLAAAWAIVLAAAVALVGVAAYFAVRLGRTASPPLVGIDPR